MSIKIICRYIWLLLVLSIGFNRNCQADPTDLRSPNLSAANSNVANLNEADSTEYNSNPLDGGYLSIGFGVRMLDEPNNYGSFLDLDVGAGIWINGRYQWKGAFIEIPGGTNNIEPLYAFGYNFLNTKRWSLDLYAAKTHADIIRLDFTGRYVVVDGELVWVPNDSSIDRDGSLRVGIRSVGWFENSSVQILFAPISSNDDYDDGIYGSFWYSRNWQQGNWNFYFNIGAQYNSEEILDYYYGVNDEDLFDRYDPYQAKEGVNFSSQVGVSYPLTKNWVLESYLRHTKLSSSITDSPLITGGNTVTESGLYISYVF